MLKPTYNNQKLTNIIYFCTSARIDTHGNIPRRTKIKEDAKAKKAVEPQSPTKPRGRIMSIFDDRGGSNFQEQTKDETNKDAADTYGGLDASLTLFK